MMAALLEVQGLAKRFGGLVAVDALSLEVAAREVHAVIGPNGAGKSTLIGTLAGELAADEGRIVFDGRDVTRLAAPARAQRGLARSFQITSVFRDFTAEDNVALAVQAKAGHSFRLWRDARTDPALRTPARAALDAVGLGARADAVAASLSHGEQRALEIAMALATAPKLLLLDEPTAGMGPEESVAMIAILKRLRADHAVLLIEHDMEVVFAVADRITVLVYGRAIASGPPDVIRASAAVREAYLGDEAR